jgi:hypothetical protein
MTKLALVRQTALNSLAMGRIVIASTTKFGNAVRVVGGDRKTVRLESGTRCGWGQLVSLNVKAGN